jgi:hypothetical protein
VYRDEDPALPLVNRDSAVTIDHRRAIAVHQQRLGTTAAAIDHRRAIAVHQQRLGTTAAAIDHQQQYC